MKRKFFPCGNLVILLKSGGYHEKVENLFVQREPPLKFERKFSFAKTWLFCFLAEGTMKSGESVSTEGATFEFCKQSVSFAENSVEMVSSETRIEMEKISLRGGCHP